MKQRQSSTKSVQKLCVAALMAALVFVSSQLQIQIPSILGFSRFHLGNSMCALSGLLLGPWWGGLASGVGSALFDLFHPAYLAEAPITLVTKGVYGLVSGLLCWRVFSGKPRYGVQALSTLCAALCYTAIYLGKTFFYNGIWLGGLTPSAAWVAVLEKAPSSLFNGAVALICAPILAVAVRRAMRTAQLEHLLPLPPRQ